MRLKASGLGCFVIILIPLAFIASMMFRDYNEHIENIECIKMGGRMKQTSSAFQAYQRNCIK